MWILHAYVADSATASLEGLDAADAEAGGTAAPLHAVDVVALGAWQAGAHQAAPGTAIFVLCGAALQVREVDHAEDWQNPWNSGQRC